MVNIASIDVREGEDEVLVVADITMPGKRGEAWYRLPPGTQTDLDAATDAFYAIGLILAMGTDGVLTMDRPVSKRLLYSTRRALQKILLMWHTGRLRSAEVDVPVRDADAAPVPDRTVACFTGGVDSFDTLLNNTEDIDALVYVHGFDVALRRTEIRETTSAHLRDVAAATGKELIEIETNIRVFLNRAGSWPLVTHGPALASIGHLLSPGYGRLLIPGSHTFADRFPWGSDPLLDHHWSSDRLSVVNDGSGSTRAEKTAGLAHDPVARNHLRVCWQNTGKYNCSECDKCVRTMIALSIAGALEDFPGFETKDPLELVQQVKVKTEGGRSFASENVEYAEKEGATEIADALRASIIAYDQRKAQKQKRASDVSAAPLDKRVAAVEERVDAALKRAAAAQKRAVTVDRRVDTMQKMWPVRTWSRFATWRHGEPGTK